MNRPADGRPDTAEPARPRRAVFPTPSGRWHPCLGPHVPDPKP